jgi:uncharacterized phage protein (TIGR02220 family)
MFQVLDFDALESALRRLPHLDVRRDNSTVSGVTLLSVTFRNWHKYQGDFSSTRVAKFREMKRSKRRGEEKRREEKKKRGDLPPKPPVAPLAFPDPPKTPTYPVNDQGQCEGCVTVLREFYSLTGRKYRLNGTPVYEGLHARHQERGVDACLGVLRLKAGEWKGDPKMDKFIRPSTLYGPKNFIEYLAEAEGSENGTD